VFDEFRAEDLEADAFRVEDFNAIDFDAPLEGGAFRVSAFEAEGLKDGLADDDLAGGFFTAAY